MKTQQRILLTALIFLLSLSTIYSQEVGFSYQAVAVDQSQAQGFGRDTQGEIMANQEINLRFSILEGSNGGAVIYQEIHNTQTDIFGIFRLVIGRGDNQLGSTLANLDWRETPYFLQVEIDLGEGYEVMGVEELLGSPYSLSNDLQSLSLQDNELSISDGNTITLVDNDATNEIQDLELTGSTLNITNNTSATSIDLSGINPALTETEVDAFVSDNGFLTSTDGAFYYYDSDTDLFGDASRPVWVPTGVAPPSNFVLNNTDCDDSSTLSNPAGTEICDGLDNNCDGFIDEGIPSQPETCDGIDNDCDGIIDENVTTTFYFDADGDGFGGAGSFIQACSAPLNFVANNSDCNDTDATIFPGSTEFCNGIDDDCNGLIDDGCI